jgi:hypothetical protein
MRPVEAIPGMREEEIKENDGGVNSSVIYLIHCKNYCGYHNVPLTSTTIKKLKIKKELSNFLFVQLFTSC